MQLTKEQLQIINSNLQDITVNSGPGMGKTTLLLEIAKQHKDKKHLILCFNSNVKKEIQDKIKKQQIKNAEVMTFHSLAFSFFKENEFFKNFKNRNFNENLNYFSIYSILYKLQLSQKIDDEYIPQILDLMLRYTKSDKKITDIISKEHILYPVFRKVTNHLIKNPNAILFHEFYIKVFQLLNPKVSHDVILIDEFQDVSPCYLSIINSISKGKKIVKVGDNLQKIYGYNGAIGIDSFNYSITQSFRIGKDNIDLCNRLVEEVLCTDIYNIEGKNETQHIVKNKQEKKVMIYRTNKQMIQDIISMTSLQKICAVSQSILDLFHTFKNLLMIEKEPVVYQGMNIYSMLQLKKITKVTEDSTLFLFFQLTKIYKNDFIQKIKRAEKYLVLEDSEKYDIRFITSHRSKGLEFENVELANDFVEFKKIKNGFLEKGDITQLDELYILYVALTRSYGTLKLNRDLERKWMMA